MKGMKYLNGMWRVLQIYTQVWSCESICDNKNCESDFIWFSNFNSKTYESPYFINLSQLSFWFRAYHFWSANKSHKEACRSLATQSLLTIHWSTLKSTTSSLISLLSFRVLLVMLSFDSNRACAQMPKRPIWRSTLTSSQHLECYSVSEISWRSFSGRTVGTAFGLSLVCNKTETATLLDALGSSRLLTLSYLRCLGGPVWHRALSCYLLSLGFTYIGDLFKNHIAYPERWPS